MIWDDKILDELDKNELRKICNPFKNLKKNENTNCLVILVFVPVILKNKR